MQSRCILLSGFRGGLGPKYRPLRPQTPNPKPWTSHPPSTVRPIVIRLKTVQEFRIYQNIWGVMPLLPRSCPMPYGVGSSFVFGEQFYRMLMRVKIQAYSPVREPSLWTVAWPRVDILFFDFLFHAVCALLGSRRKPRPGFAFVSLWGSRPGLSRSAIGDQIMAAPIV